MANWNALFPRLGAQDITKLKTYIAGEKEKALAVFQDREARALKNGDSYLSRRLASVVALGSDQSFGGHAAGLPFIDVDWLTERRKSRETLHHDGVETVVANRYNFDRGWLWLLRGQILAGDIMACQAAYPRVRAAIEALESPYGEAAVRAALLDEFPHMLQVIPILAREGKIAVRVRDGVVSLAAFGDQVESYETCMDALNRVIGATRWNARSAAAVRFERRMPAITLTHHVTLERGHKLPQSLPPVSWVPEEAIFKARKGDCADLDAVLGALRPGGLRLDPDDSEAFILTV